MEKSGSDVFADALNQDIPVDNLYDAFGVNVLAITDRLADMDGQSCSVISKQAYQIVSVLTVALHEIRRISIRKMCSVICVACLILDGDPDDLLLPMEMLIMSRL